MEGYRRSERGQTLREKHPDFFGPMKIVDPRGKKRSVPMECLNLGFNRTGTTTMAAAMEILGIHAYHSLLWFTSNLGDTDMWSEAIDAKFYGKGKRFGREEWDQLLHDFGGLSSDTPAIAFSEDLIEAYPEAKVVLTNRDFDSWFRSYDNSVLAAFCSRLNNSLVAIDPWLAGRIGKPHRRVHQAWVGGEWMDREDMGEKAKQAFKDHYALVRRVTPPERLLEFRLEDGWGPLCEFLGKPVPDVPFPRLNDTEALKEKISILIRRSIVGLLERLLIYGLPVLVALLAFYYYMMTSV